MQFPKTGPRFVAPRLTTDEVLSFTLEGLTIGARAVPIPWRSP